MSKNSKIIIASCLSIVVILAIVLGCIYGIKLTVTLDYSYEVSGSTGLTNLLAENIQTVKEVKVTRGATYAPERPTRSGYVFKGWYKDSALTIPWTSDDRVNANITLYAKWEAVD